MEGDKDLLCAILNNYLENENVVKVISAESKAATVKGDNYTSVMYRVTMQVILKSGKIKRKCVIIKELPENIYYQNFWGKMGIFYKEIIVYRDILPHLESVMQEYGDYTEPMWCKCLDYTPYYRIVFEDLAQLGYTMADRRIGLDFEHCQLVLRSLAKFHATSVILYERGLINMEIFKENLMVKESERGLFEGMYKETLRKLTNTMEQRWDPKWKPIAEKLRTEISPNIMELLANIFAQENCKLNVFCHGDCWSNNLLFKYGLDGVTPISVKFVDFQISSYNSPAFDLKYFLISSTNEHVWKNFKTKLLEIYYETLIKQLKFYNYEGNLISLNDLHEEMDRIDLFGVNVAIRLLPVLRLKNMDSIPDVEEILKNALNQTRRENDFNVFVDSSPDVIRVIQEVLEDFAKRHFSIQI